MRPKPKAQEGQSPKKPKSIHEWQGQALNKRASFCIVVGGVDIK